MLRGGQRKIRRANEWKKQTFQDFNSRGKERDGAIGRTKVKRFTGFRDRDYMGGLPDSREVSMVNRKVKELSQVGNSQGAKVFQVNRGKTIRASSGRIFRVVNSFSS